MAVATGIIGLWCGTLASIPTNWSLCDGNSGRPNLLNRYIKSVPASTDPGTTGGHTGTHSHTMTSSGTHQHSFASAAHSHATSSAGSHSHDTGVSGDAGRGFDYIQGGSAGGHRHTWGSGGAHSHGSGSVTSEGNHSHSVDNGDATPPTYAVAYIYAESGAAVEQGLIIIWSKLISEIPTGWELCDGSGTTPNLTGKFVRCVADGSTDPGSTSGSTSHSHSIGSSSKHEHTGSSASSSFSHTHSAPYSSEVGFHEHITNSLFGSYREAPDWARYNWSHDHGLSSLSSAGSYHTHSISGSSGAHDDHNIGDGDNLPSYTDILFIRCTTATDLPDYGIVIWTGLIANIPDDYYLCDGNNETPNLIDYFIRGAPSSTEAGGTGGSNTHSHSIGNGGSHSHSCGLGGAHSHGSPSQAVTGSHQHMGGYVGIAYEDYSRAFSETTAGYHSHSTDTSDSGHIHDTTGGSHDHGGSMSGENRPYFYEVAFIMYSVVPEVETQPATSVTETTARINARIIEDAGCSLDVQFRWRIRE